MISASSFIENNERKIFLIKEAQNELAKKKLLDK